MVRIPAGILADITHHERTHGAETEPRSYLGHRVEDGEWVVIWRLESGEVVERRYERWEADRIKRARENRAAREARRGFRAV